MSSAIGPSIENIRDRLSDLSTRLDALSNWIETTVDRVAELEDENAELRQRLETVEARLDVVESGDTGKEGKLRKIVTGAENVRISDQTAIVMDAAKIVTVTGVSRRYAYDLIEDLPDEYHWILSRKEARQQQYGSIEIDADAQTKAIVVDFERLHTDPEAVNKFTTAPTGEGE